MPPRFAKEVPKGRESNAKESEKRRFRERCCAEFPTLSTPQLDTIVPPGKGAALRVCKLPPRDELFRCEWAPGLQQPVFWTEDAPSAGGDRKPASQLVPTLYALHKAPQLVRVVRYFRPVEKHLARGADLFLPGVAREDDFAERAREAGVDWPEHVFGGRFAKGELCALVAHNGWAPVAVGRFALSSADALVTGMGHGVAVEVLHHLGDALWATGSREAPPAAPPVLAEEAVTAYHEARARATAAEAEEQARRAGLARAREREERHAELTRTIRKGEKVLRQICELKVTRLGLSEEAGAADVERATQAVASAGSALNADQLLKLSKEEATRAEIEAATRELAEMNAADAPAAAADPDAPPPPPQEDSAKDDAPSATPADSVARCSDGFDSEHAGEEEEGAAADGDDVATADDDDEADEDDEVAAADADADDDDAAQSQEDIDALFLAAALTTLRHVPLPLSAAALFSGAARRAGQNIKATRWKRGGRLLDELCEQGVIVTREAQKGVVEVSEVDWSCAPPFEEVDEPADDASDSIAPDGLFTRHAVATGANALRATKRGKAIVVSLRKVRNKNGARALAPVGLSLGHFPSKTHAPLQLRLSTASRRGASRTR